MVGFPISKLEGKHHSIRVCHWILLDNTPYRWQSRKNRGVYFLGKLKYLKLQTFFWIQSQGKHMICNLQDWGDWWLNMGLPWTHQRPGLIEAPFAVARRWLPFQVMPHVLPKHIMYTYCNGNTSAHTVIPGTEPYWSIHFLVIISPCFLFSSGLYSW